MALSYASRLGYKLSLSVEYDIDIIKIMCSKLSFEQIIRSLLCNIMYFMAVGSNIKKLRIQILQDRIIWEYDAFAANETHMKNWSQDIALEIGNHLILNCNELFEQLIFYGCRYEIIPKQGCNKVIIWYRRQDNTIIQFPKKNNHSNS